VTAARPLIVGILNVTPDSFSDGGLRPTLEAQVRSGEEMAASGADIVEVGGESTRPGASPVPLEEEIRRVLPVVEALGERIRVPISVDTAKAEVARRALDSGARMVNDVTALRADPAMAAVIAEREAEVVLMHMRGTPRTMQDHPYYEDVVGEIEAFLAERIRFAESEGIARDKIVVDPGIGFGKRVSDNLRILRDLERLHSLSCPIMIGASRKSFLGAVTGRAVSEREIGTCVAGFFALLGGARYLRVHDVGNALDLVRLFGAVREASAAYDGIPVHGNSD